MISKKFIKPKSLIFCKGKLTHKERIIYNYLLFRLKEDKQFIIKEKIEDKSYKYKEYSLQVSLKELKEQLGLSKKKDIIKIFCNLGKTDIVETEFNYARKNKSSFNAPLINKVEDYSCKNESFKITFSSLIINEVLLNTNDYVTLNLDDLSKFRSKYSLILYEILRASYVPYFNNNKPLRMCLNEFKCLLNIEKYNISNLKQRVLKKAKQDIESLTDYKFEYNFLRGDKGNNFKFIEFSFDIKESLRKDFYIENKKVKNLTQEELIYIFKNKLNESFYIEQLNKEIRELRNALSIQTRKAEKAIDELDLIYQ